MGWIQSRIAKRLTTCSNMRLSRAHSYCTQFTKDMHVFLSIRPRTVETTASIHASPGRFFAHQPMASRRWANSIAPQAKVYAMTFGSVPIDVRPGEVSSRYSYRRCTSRQPSGTPNPLLRAARPRPSPLKAGLSSPRRRLWRRLLDSQPAHQPGKPTSRRSKSI